MDIDHTFPRTKESLWRKCSDTALGRNNSMMFEESARSNASQGAARGSPAVLLASCRTSSSRSTSGNAGRTWRGSVATSEPCRTKQTSFMGCTCTWVVPGKARRPRRSRRPRRPRRPRRLGNSEDPPFQLAKVKLCPSPAIKVRFRLICCCFN